MTVNPYHWLSQSFAAQAAVGVSLSSLHKNISAKISLTMMLFIYSSVYDHSISSLYQQQEGTV